MPVRNATITYVILQHRQAPPTTVSTDPVSIIPSSMDGGSNLKTTLIAIENNRPASDELRIMDGNDGTNSPTPNPRPTQCRNAPFAATSSPIFHAHCGSR
jgi:hypothetical protein